MKLSRSFQKQSEPKFFKFSQRVNILRNFFGFIDNYIFHIVNWAIYDYSIVAHLIHSAP